MKTNIKNTFLLLKNLIRKNLFFSILLTISAFSIISNAKGNWFLGKSDNCVEMIDLIIKKPLVGLKEPHLTKTKNFCYEEILKKGDYQDLYAYYKGYDYINRINNYKGAKNIYHWMLFYANENSRNFNQKTQDFEKPFGLYEEELKDFEDNLTQEEKIKSFYYIADNIATGEQGWVKKHDYVKSFEYLKKSAEAGDVKSQKKLSECYYAGTDFMNKFLIEKNFIESYKWMFVSNKFQTQNEYLFNYSKESLKVLERKLSNQQISQAKKLAQDWLDKNSEFVKKNPLKIIKMTQEEIEKEKQKTKDFINKYNLYNTNSIEKTN